MRKYIFVLMAPLLLSNCAHAGEPPQQIMTAEKPHAEFTVYDAQVDAVAQVDAALVRAGANGTKALIVMGANWCHDSRGLAARFSRPEFQTLISQNYELVYVNAGTDPGQKDQNQTISKRFGVDAIQGTPTVFIAKPDGTVLNGESTGYWRHADAIPTDMSFAYFDMYAKK